MDPLSMDPSCATLKSEALLLPIAGARIQSGSRVRGDHPPWLGNPAKEELGCGGGRASCLIARFLPADGMALSTDI